MAKEQLSVLAEFQPVRGKFWNQVLGKTHWVAVASYVPVGLFYHDPMLAAVGLAMGLYALSFNHAVAQIPRVLESLWDREGRNEEQRLPAGKLLITEANYVAFIKSADHALNSWAQWIFAALGGLLMFLKYMTAYYKSSSGWKGFPAFIQFLHDHYILGMPFTGAFHDRSPSALLLLIEPVLGFLLGMIAWRLFMLGTNVWRLGSQYALSTAILHPDRCGGLADIGRMCVWNAISLAGPGFYCGFWIAFGSRFGYQDKWDTFLWIILVVIAVLACVSFFLPLWGIHSQMVKKREDLFRDWESVRAGINDIIFSLKAENRKLSVANYSEITQHIKCLEEMSIYYQKMPVWPFNMEIISKLALSQAGTLVAFVGIILKL